MSFEKISLDNPDVDEFKRNLAIAHDRMGDIYLELSDYDNALLKYEIYLKISMELNQKNPADPEYLENYAMSKQVMGRVYYLKGDTASALKQYKYSGDILKKLAEKNPANMEYVKQLRIMTSSLFY